MKNRKAPVLLFGVLVVALGAMTVINAVQKPHDHEADHQHEEEKVAERQLTDDERAKASSSVLDALDSKSGKSTGDGKKPMTPTDESGERTEMATEPTIIIKSYTATRPVPNDASTATHWYNEKSRSYKLADENAKSRG